MSEECRSCGHPVSWAQHADDPSKSNMPFDTDKVDDPRGKYAVWRGPHGELLYRYLPKDTEPGPGQHRGYSHWASCKDADQWRSRTKTTTR